MGKREVFGSASLDQERRSQMQGLENCWRAGGGGEGAHKGTLIKARTLMLKRQTF